MQPQDPSYTTEAILSRYDSEDAFWNFVTQAITFTKREREVFLLRDEGLALSKEQLYDMYRGMLVVSGALLEAFVLSNRYLDDAKGSDEALLRSQLARQAVAKKLESDPKALVMAEIRDEWLARKRRGDKFKAVDFAREMQQRSQYRVVTLEAIRNAQTRWAKGFHPAG